MNAAEKLDLIARFEYAYGAIEALIRGLSALDRRYVPPVEAAWSIDETLVHFLDADSSLVFRLRMCVAQPGFTVPVWDQEAWKSRLRYAEEDGPASLREAEAIRRRMAAFLRRFVEEDWAGYYIVHPERGRLALADVLAMYCDHVAFHVPLIQRNLNALKAADSR